MYINVSSTTHKLYKGRITHPSHINTNTNSVLKENKDWNGGGGESIAIKSITYQLHDSSTSVTTTNAKMSSDTHLGSSNTTLL